MEIVTVMEERRQRTRMLERKKKRTKQDFNRLLLQGRKNEDSAHQDAIPGKEEQRIQRLH